MGTSQSWKPRIAGSRVPLVSARFTFEAQERSRARNGHVVARQQGLLRIDGDNCRAVADRAAAVFVDDAGASQQRLLSVAPELSRTARKPQDDRRVTGVCRALPIGVGRSIKR